MRLTDPPLAWVEALDRVAEQAEGPVVPGVAVRGGLLDRIARLEGRREASDEPVQDGASPR